jgi:hypothetical protein
MSTNDGPDQPVGRAFRHPGGHAFDTDKGPGIRPSRLPRIPVCIEDGAAGAMPSFVAAGRPRSGMTPSATRSTDGQRRGSRATWRRPDTPAKQDRPPRPYTSDTSQEPTVDGPMTHSTVSDASGSASRACAAPRAVPRFDGGPERGVVAVVLVRVCLPAKSANRAGRTCRRCPEYADDRDRVATGRRGLVRGETGVTACRRKPPSPASPEARGVEPVPFIVSQLAEVEVRGLPGPRVPAEEDIRGGLHQPLADPRPPRRGVPRGACCLDEWLCARTAVASLVAWRISGRPDPGRTSSTMKQRVPDAATTDDLHSAKVHEFSAKSTEPDSVRRARAGSPPASPGSR